MLIQAISILLSAGIATSTPECSSEIEAAEYHLSDVCDPLLEGAEAYSATFRASLVPSPASQQVLVYRADADGWFVRIAGYNWTDDIVVTRRRDLPISDDDAAQISALITEVTFERLSALPYYGSPDIVCTDGANLQLAMVLNGQRNFVAQHTCAGRTEINDLSEAFRSLAIKYDPESLGLLNGLAN